nr:unnamed protein product [Naegleria fowleri]
MIRNNHSSLHRMSSSPIPATSSTPLSTASLPSDILTNGVGPFSPTNNDNGSTTSPSTLVGGEEQEDRKFKRLSYVMTDDNQTTSQMEDYDVDPLQTMEQNITSLHTIIDKLSILFKPLQPSSPNDMSSSSNNLLLMSSSSSSSLNNNSFYGSNTTTLSITKVEPQFGLLQSRTKVTIYFNSPIFTNIPSTITTNQLKPEERFKIVFGKQLIEPTINLSEQTLSFFTPPISNLVAATSSPTTSSILNTIANNSHEIKVLDLSNCQFITSNPTLTFTFLTDPKEEVLTDLEKVKTLYNEKGVSWLHEKTYPKGQTVVHVAFKLAQFEVVKYLVTQSDQIDCLDQKDDNGQTPLDVAMAAKNYYFMTQIVEWLKTIVKQKIQMQQMQYNTTNQAAIMMNDQQKEPNSPQIATTISTPTKKLVSPLSISHISNNETNEFSSTPINAIEPPMTPSRSSRAALITTTREFDGGPTSSSVPTTLSPLSSRMSSHNEWSEDGMSGGQSGGGGGGQSGSVHSSGSGMSVANNGTLMKHRSGHKRLFTSSSSSSGVPLKAVNQPSPSLVMTTPISNASADEDVSSSTDEESDAVYTAGTPIRSVATLEEREEEAIANLIVKYRLDQYSEIYTNMSNRDDILVQKITKKLEMKDDWGDNATKKRKETMLVPLTRERSFLEEVQLERRANPFKPSIYYDEEVDDGYTESTLLLSQFFEDSAKNLPFHVLSTIQTMSSDFIIVTFKTLLDHKSKELVFNVDDLKPITYEMDVSDRIRKKTEDRKKLSATSPSPSSTTSSLDELDVSLVIPEKQKILPMEGLQDSEFLLATFEDVFPCEDQQKVTKSNDDTKLLYSDFEWESSHIDPTSQYLFELKGFELDVNKKFEVPLEEAYFITVSLYTYTDKAYKKISEDVEFKIETHPKEEDTITKVKAMFSVQKTMESKVVVLIKFYRKFRGELTETLNDFYTQKAEKVKQGDVKKFLTRNEKFSTFPGIANTTSIFAWTAIHLHECLRKTEVHLTDCLYVLPLKCRSGDATLLDNYLDVYTNVEDRDDKPLMKKSLYGKMSFVLKELPNVPPIPRHYHPNSHELVIKLDSKHLRVQHIPNLENSLMTKLLPLSSEMIVYPKELNLVRKDYKNIVVRVSFCNEKEKHKPFHVFYSKFSRNPANRVSHRQTSVCVGNRQPEFSEEFKCILPCTLSGQHIFYFEFLNILHKESLILKNHREDVQRIGYATLRVLSDPKMNSTETVLDIYTERKEGNVIKTEKLEGSFTVQLYSRSIAFPTDENLSNFFLFLDNFQRKNTAKGARKERDFFEELTNRELLSILPGLSKVQQMAFAPVILNQLFLLYFDMSDEDLQNSIFCTIIDMVDKYRTEHRTIVPGWIKFQFTSVFPETMMTKLPMIATSVKSILEKPEYDSKVIKNVACLFSILLKAMVVHLDYVKNKCQDTNYDFDDHFYATINTITTKSFRGLLRRNILTTRPVTIINTTVIYAQFLKILFTIIDKPYVMKLIASFVELLPLIIPNENEMDKKSKNTILECVANLQVLTYKEVFSYDNYLQLFIPESVENILKQETLPVLDGTHFLFSSFVDVILKNITSPIKEIRNNTSLIWREFLVKLLILSKSPLFEDAPEIDDRIHLMTFEFVEKFLTVLQDWRTEVDKSVNSNKMKMNDCKKRKIMIQQQLAAKKESQRSAKENSLANFQVDTLNKEIQILETNYKQFDSMINKTKEELKKDMKESFKEKRQLVACIFHILKNVDQRYLQRWIKESISSKRIQFLQLMQLMLQSFEYQSEEYFKVFYEHYYNTQVKVKAKEENKSSGEYPSSMIANANSPNHTLNKSLTPTTISSSSSSTGGNHVGGNSSHGNSTGSSSNGSGGNTGSVVNINSSNQQQQQQAWSMTSSHSTPTAAASATTNSTSNTSSATTTTTTTTTNNTSNTPHETPQEMIAGEIEEIPSPKTATSELVKAGHSLQKKKNNKGFLSRLVPGAARFVSSDQNLREDVKELRSYHSKSKLLESSDKTKSVKLETSATNYVKKCVIIEQNWSREVSNYVFELLVFYVEYILNNSSVEQLNVQILDSANLLDHIVKIFLSFLRINQPEDVLINVLIYLKSFFATSYRSIFDEEINAQYPTLFCECLMMHCNSPLVEVRQHATACLYLLIRYMYMINYNTILKPQVLTTLALSKTLQKFVSSIVNIDYLKSAIDAIGKYAYLDPNPPSSSQHLQHLQNLTVKPSQNHGIDNGNNNGNNNTIANDNNAIDNTSFNHHDSIHHRSSNSNDSNIKGLLLRPSASSEGVQLNSIYSNLSNIEHEVKLRSTVQDKTEESSFAEEVNSQVCKKLLSLLQDTTSVKTTLALEDIHKTEDLFLRISHVYTRIPELRFVWLNQLAANHIKHGQYLEASQCYLTILSLVFDHLESTKSPILNGIPSQNLAAISPLKRLKHQVVAGTTTTSTSIHNNNGKSINSLMTMGDCFISNQAIEFTEHGIMTLLTKAIEALELAEFFETCIVLEKLAIPFLERVNDWERLANTYHHLQDLCDRLKKPDRLEPYYYKVELVNFPADKAQPSHIYKMPKLFKLFKMNKWVQEKFGSPFMNDTIEVVSGAKKVDIDPNKKYIFLTPVKPLTKEIKQPVIGNQKISKYEGSVSKFYYESAYGKKTELVTEAYKKKVIITCVDSFPSMKTRLMIEAEKEIILTPIESAIDNIDSQISKLRDALQIPGQDEDIDISQITIGTNIDLQNLQLVLQGSIKATVQGGPASIVEGFLKMDQRPLYPIDHIITLNRKCHIFLRLCEEAVKVENQMIDKATERAFHQEMEKALIETQHLFAQHLTPIDYERFYTQTPNHQNYNNEGDENGDVETGIRNLRLGLGEEHMDDDLL